MSGGFEVTRPLPGARFGATVRLPGAGTRTVVAAAEAEPGLLPRLLGEANGLLLLPGMEAIEQEPELFLRLSRLFGPEVENYRTTLTKANAVHPEVKEIFIVSNIPPVGRAPPPLPDPPLTADGRFPVQYPQRKGWHTDQSYRRPPPDVSLFTALIPAPKGQGQTLFASGILAWESLPAELKARVERLDGLHMQPGQGRSREAVRRGEPARPLAPHERPQRQPIVRTHPVTGARALYLCESGQMDWLEGPIVGMEPGPDGAGGRLVDELMAHITRPEHVYVHDWDKGDLVIWDNRCLMHAASWFDHEKHGRLMWRTTVHGNPGAAYAGEAKSWIPRQVAAE